jgi:hypothetical protein
MKAKINSACIICEEKIAPGEDIEKFGNRWVHKGCGMYVVNQEKVQSGTTYASQKKSDYRRKIHRE